MSSRNFLYIAILCSICFSPYLVSKSKSLKNLWPLANSRLIHLKDFAWYNKFLTLVDDTDIVLVSPSTNQTNNIFSFPYDIVAVQGLRLNRGVLIAGLSKNRRIINFVGFSDKWNMVYQETLRLPYVIASFDAQLNNRGRPLILLHSYNQQNHLISLWDDGNLHELYRSHYNIKASIIEQSTNSVHILHQSTAEQIWLIYKDDQYHEFKLPIQLVQNFFLTVDHTVLLLGVDAKGTLWRFSLNNQKLSSVRVYRDPRLIFVSQITLVYHKSKLSLFMVSNDKGYIWKVDFKNFIKNPRLNRVSKQRILGNTSLHPIYLGENLNILIETPLKHVYLTSWGADKLAIYDVKWKISGEKTAQLTISWKNAKKSTKLLYSYLMDQKSNSEPLDEYSYLPRNQAILYNLKEGNYILHLQAYDKKAKIKSPIYHIPILLLYTPPEPKISFLNEISPSVFHPGAIRFYIQDKLDINYYAEVNKIPVYTPKKKLQLKSRIADIYVGESEDWYYLHMRSQEPNTKKYSTVLHVPFSMRPSGTSLEGGNGFIDHIYHELQLLLKKTDSVNNQNSINEIRKRLDVLQEKLEND